MQPTNRLNPRVKQELKTLLIEFLYVNVNRKFNERLKAIIDKNTIDSRYPHYSFSYKGEYFSFELKAPRFKTQRLLPELRPSMDEYLADRKELEFTEIPYVTTFFTRVLITANTLPDYYRLLPDCMHRALDQLNIENPAPGVLTDEQVEQFHNENKDLILLIKKRMVLDLIT